MRSPTFRVISLGAGVQSSTLYLMAVHGEFGDERPAAAIFADTQWEPRAVYEWLDELERIGGAVIPIRRETAGSLRAMALPRRDASGRPARSVAIPAFAAVPSEDERQVVLWDMPILRKAGIRPRHCTDEFKIAVIRRGVRRALGVGPRVKLAAGAVEQWIGISTDEADREAPSRVGYVVNRHPLLERGLSRADCAAWLREHGYPEPPKSACIGCPFASDARWHEMKHQRPGEFADAVAFDAEIRHGLRGQTHPVYLHRSLKPLSEVVFDATDARTGFSNECKGMCGV